MRVNLAKMSVLEKYRYKPKAEGKDNRVDQYLEDFRKKIFEGNQRSNLILWNKGQINWPSVVKAYQFHDKKEAQVWFAQMVAGVKGLV